VEWIRGNLEITAVDAGNVLSSTKIWQVYNEDLQKQEKQPMESAKTFKKLLGQVFPGIDIRRKNIRYSQVTYILHTIVQNI